MKPSIARNSLVTLSIGLALASVSALAQNTAPVVDLSAANPGATQAVKKPDAAVGDSYYQSQMLQNEVRELRGMVEQLSYELQRVKQRQMDDYLDIDRRLSAAMSGLPAAGAAENTEGETAASAVTGQALDPAEAGISAAVSANPQTVVQADDQVAIQLPNEPVANSEEIAESYAQASNLLLKQRDFNGAVAAFKQHVIDYPASPYTANAHYWLGEIYLLQGQDELARQAFTLIVDQYPAHGKALDANFKLG
ncbi:MAG: YbgF trimerization domain-containing protein, partial [Porticoccaceae bacterium]